MMSLPPGSVAYQPMVAPTGAVPVSQQQLQYNAKSAMQQVYVTPQMQPMTSQQQQIMTSQAVVKKT